MTYKEDLRLRDLAFKKMRELEKEIKVAKGDDIIRLTAQYQHLRGLIATYGKV